MVIPSHIRCDVEEWHSVKQSGSLMIDELFSSTVRTIKAIAQFLKRFLSFCDMKTVWIISQMCNMSKCDDLEEIQDGCFHISSWDLLKIAVFQMFLPWLYNQCLALLCDNHCITQNLVCTVTKSVVEMSA